MMKYDLFQSIYILLLRALINFSRRGIRKQSWYSHKLQKEPLKLTAMFTRV